MKGWSIMRQASRPEREKGRHYVALTGNGRWTATDVDAIRKFENKNEAGLLVLSLGVGARVVLYDAAIIEIERQSGVEGGLCALRHPTLIFLKEKEVQ